jgi:hypothetical protein
LEVEDEGLMSTIEEKEVRRMGEGEGKEDRKVRLAYSILILLSYRA